MRLLILGGTQFVGRHLVEAAVAQGHEVTLFHRGQTAPTLFPGLARRLGDRRADLSALAEGEWDAVLDCCGYLPREVAATAKLLKGRVGQYLYISSVSAYASFAAPNAEDSPLGQLSDPDTEVIDGASYGPLKAACEVALLAHFASPLILRPSLVVGPFDPTQRFTYWPARVASAQAGEPVLVPAPAQEPLQFIDARDLAEFALLALSRGLTGRFNVAGTPGQVNGHVTRQDLLDACVAAAGLAAAPAWVWADSAALMAQGVKPWNELPLWLPPEHEYAGFMQCSNAAALQAGLRLRPLRDTVADTLAWWQSLPEAEQQFSRAGLSPQREREVLAGLAGAAS